MTCSSERRGPPNNRMPTELNSSGTPAGGAIRPKFAELAADALRYWEPRRLLYNLALLTVVLVHIFASWPRSKATLVMNPVFVFFVLAVLANIAYCAAYAIDLFVRFSGLRHAWPRWRWLVLLTGTAFACVIAHFFTLGILGGGGAD